jgi:hypothetical protein
MDCFQLEIIAPWINLNGYNIVTAKYLSAIFDKKITWMLHTETIEAKAFRTFIRIYLLFKSKQLSTNIKLNLHKILIRSAMIYACLTWEFGAETNLLKL